MTVAEALDHLRDTIAAQYPARIAERSNRPGRVTCIVAPDSVEYEPLDCDPVPATLAAQITILSGGTAGEQVVRDLLIAVDPIAALVRAAGFTPTGWRPGDYDGQAAVILDASIDAEG